MAMHRGRGIASINYPIGMNLGGDPARRWCIPIRAQVHSPLSLDRSRSGMKSVTGRSAPRHSAPGRDVACRHRRFRHRAALHGQFRLARHPSRRQRGDGRCEGSARRHDGGGGRGARGQCCRPRDRRAATFTSGAPHRSISTKDVAIAAIIQARQDDLRAWHLPAPLSAVDPETGDVAGDLLRARLHGRRGRGRRRDRRSGDGADGQRLRLWARAQSAAGRTATGRRPGWESATRS